MRRISRVIAAVVAAGVLAGGLTACTNDPLVDQYRAGDNKGYIGADGVRVVEIAPADREKPVVFTGTLDAGGTVSSADFAGKVLVVNFWYAACGPCRVEAPLLEKAYQATDRSQVAFLGVNTSDESAASLSFAENYGVSYPSVLAAGDSALKLAFAASTPLTATPTTLVIDKQGRVAARIIGEIDESVLTTLVRDAVAES